MAVVDGEEDLAKHGGGILFGVVGGGNDAIEEFSASAEPRDCITQGTLG
jgi:hypothetical protein